MLLLRTNLDTTMVAVQRSETHSALFAREAVW
jgi:hypothetical protein